MEKMYQGEPISRHPWEVVEGTLDQVQSHYCMTEEAARFLAEQLNKIDPRCGACARPNRSFKEEI